MASTEKAYHHACKLRKAAKSLLAFAALTLALSRHSAQAQTFAEWFKQKSTQRKYLLQQIAALQLYHQYARKGYEVAKGGLGSIGRNAANEYGLHDHYYQNLRTVNASVSGGPQVKAILKWQQDIFEQVNRAQKIKGLTNAESGHIKKVCAALLKDCDGQLNDLETVLKNGKAEMSDEQRLRQIGRLYDNMQDNYRFAANFSAQVRIYALQKAQGVMDVNSIKNLYGSDH